MTADDRCAALEAHLGDADDATNELSWARAVARDEVEEYPAAAAAALERWGLHRVYVPLHLDGRLRSFEELIALERLIARRDLTLSVSHSKTLYGVMPAWIAGSEAQQRSAARTVLAGGQASLAYHEKAHGSDLQNVETSAVRTADGWLVTGQKWLVNNATRGAALSLFARTDPSGGPRAHSVLWLEKEHLDPARIEYLPRLRPLGIRGADFSGIRFTGCLAPPDAVLGEPGSGFDVSMRTFQVTRALMPAISLGAADTALRTTLDFICARRLYGTTAVELAYPRAIVAGAFADLLRCEAVVRAAARALHVATDKMRLWSSVTKLVVPLTVDGIFQKVQRDHAVVRVFHAGGFLLLQSIGQYLRWLAARKKRLPIDEARPPAIFGSDEPLPPFVAARVQSQLADGGDVVRELESAEAALGALAGRIDGGTHRCLVDLVADAAAFARAEEERLVEQDRQLGRSFGGSAELFELARRFGLMCAAACALQTWLHERERLAPELQGGEWVALALHRTLPALAGARAPLPPAMVESTARAVLHLHRERRLFSLFPMAVR